MAWLKRKILRRKQISISVIGIGNTGYKIGNLLIKKLKENKINVKSLVIDYQENREIDLEFGDHLWLARNKKTSNKNLEEAKELIKRKSEELRDKLENVVFYTKEDKTEELALHLILASAGGTGAAGSMVASGILKEITGNPPTVIFVVPEKNETSLVQFNAATALHYLGFDNKGPQCPIILFDNEKLIASPTNEIITVDKALDRSNQYLAETLTTTILSAMQESHHEEYDASLDDFFRVFSTESKGIGIIVSVDKTFESMEKAQNIRFSDVFFKELEETSSLTADVTKARSGFLTITAPDSYQITFETKKLIKSFEKGTIKVALSSIDEPVLSIRGVLTGLHPDFVDRFWDILERGRESRKKVIEKEKSIESSRIILSS